MVTVVSIVLAIFCTVWLIQSVVFVRNVRNMRTLATLTPPDPERWPRISVVMPARDEAYAVGAALHSRLADDYPDLEVIVVDDRSTDQTGDIVREIAASDDRVRYVRIDELPDGWLGKVHALETGRGAASGEWLLFSDADVRVEPGTMRKTVAHCIDQGFDHVALIPEYLLGTAPVMAVWTVFLRVFGIGVDFAAVRDPAKKSAMGSGAFNFVRREAFEQTPGFEWLRLETTDDMSLGLMMKRAGFRSEGLNGRGTATVEMYRSVGHFLRGAEKNAGAILGPPEIAVYVLSPVWVVLEWAPLLALAVGPAWLRVLGALALATGTAINIWGLRINTGKTAVGFLWPLGSAIFAWALMRATWLAHRRKGVMWRDTLYPIDEILEHRRFTLS